MGGEIFVGVRRKDGSEHLSLRWTNCMPAWIEDPSFFEDGPGMDEFIAEARRGNSWPKAVPASRVGPSEYGVILVDFPTRAILSRQGYCTVGVNRVNIVRTIPDGLLSFLTLLDMGLVRSVHTDRLLRGDPLPDEEVRHLASVCRKFVQAGKIPDDLEFAYRFQPGDLVVDDRGDRAASCWGEVKGWLKARGWRSRSSAQVPDE